MDEVPSRITGGGVDLLHSRVGLLPPVRRRDTLLRTLASRCDTLGVGQLLLGRDEVVRILNVQDVLSVWGRTGVEGGESDVDADDPFRCSRYGDRSRDLDIEGNEKLSVAQRRRGGHDAARAPLQVTAEFTHRLVGLDLTDAGDAHVVGIGESDRTGEEAHRATLTPPLERRELRSTLAVTGEGLGQLQARVVVGRRAVLTPPRRQLSSRFAYQSF